MSVLFLPLLRIVKAPTRFPAAVGANEIVNLHRLCAASAEVQVLAFSTIAKSPLIDAPSIVIVAPRGFAIVSFFVFPPLAGVPTASLPNFNRFGVSLSVEVTGVAVAVGVGLRVAVGVGVAAGVAVAVGVAVIVAVAVAVRVGVRGGVAVLVGVALGVRVSVAVAVLLGAAVGVGEGRAVGRVLAPAPVAC